MPYILPGTIIPEVNAEGLDKAEIVNVKRLRGQALSLISFLNHREIGIVTRHEHRKIQMAIPEIIEQRKLQEQIELVVDFLRNSPEIYYFI